MLIGSHINTSPDYNVNSQLNRFYLHNGGAQDNGLLNEKWESLALVPVTPSNDGSDGNFFLFSMSDNDFITQVSGITASCMLRLC